jgi:hypothetical protein
LPLQSGLAVRNVYFKGVSHILTRIAMTVSL